MHTPAIRRWLVEAAQRIDGALGPARVARLALPPLMDNPGKEGEFCAVQLDDGSVGLAFTLLDGTLAALHARRERGNESTGATAVDLVGGYAAGDAAARAVGLAAINALARRLYDRAGFVPEDSVDSFGSLALAPGDRLGMVGHFSSLIRQARSLGVPVTVLELRPGIMATDMTAGVKDKYDALIAEGLVPQRRWGTPEDVGRAVRAVLAGHLPFTTGDVIHLDGGFHIRRL